MPARFIHLLLKWKCDQLWCIVYRSASEKSSIAALFQVVIWARRIPLRWPLTYCHRSSGGNCRKTELNLFLYVEESVECITSRTLQVTSSLPSSSAIPEFRRLVWTVHLSPGIGFLLLLLLLLLPPSLWFDFIVTISVFVGISSLDCELKRTFQLDCVHQLGDFVKNDLIVSIQVSSPVALNVPVPMEEDAVDAVFLPQRRSPGQRSQDSGFSGYSDSSEGSSNNSPIPKEGTPPAAAAAAAPLAPTASRRSPINLAEAGVLETDLDAPAGIGSRHVSRVYIGVGDVICQKNIQPVNLSGFTS